MTRVLFILSRFPYPLEKGDKLRAYQHIKNMHKAGFEVHIAALSDCPVHQSHIDAVKPWCSGIHFIRMNKLHLAGNLAGAFSRNLPLQVGYFYSKRNQEFFDEVISKVKPDIIYCQLIRTALFARNHRNIPCVIDYQDAFSKGTRQRTINANPLLKPLYTREIKLVDDFEKSAFGWFDEHIIISQQDKNYLHFEEKDHVHIIPNGVDTEFFKPQQVSPEFEITFVGNMNYPPNIEASCYLVRDIMPMVWKILPGCRVQLAGANPAARVRSLASAEVTVTGWVNDIRDCYSKTKVFIAPMKSGTGLQNKLLEAMAMGIPSVTTPLSFNPLGGAVSGSDILVGNTARELADHLISLLTKPGLAATIASGGFRFVTENYSLEHSQKLLTGVLHAALTSHGSEK